MKLMKTMSRWLFRLAIVFQFVNVIINSEWGVLLLLKIKEFRKARNITAKELASHIGVAESTMSLYENGKREPDFNTLVRIAKLLGTSVDNLLGNDTSESAHPKGKKIPVFGSVAAGIPIEAITDIEDYEEISEKLAESGEFVALKIRGASMEPLMVDGDTVIVRVQNTIETGEIAVVMVGGSEATCKKIKKTPEGIFLISQNPAFDPMFFRNSEIEEMPVRIFGKVVELRRNF